MSGTQVCGESLMEIVFDLVWRGRRLRWSFSDEPEQVELEEEVVRPVGGEGGQFELATAFEHERADRVGFVGPAKRVVD